VSPAEHAALLVTLLAPRGIEALHDDTRARDPLALLERPRHPNIPFSCER
jgi:hypothetical protein